MTPTRPLVATLVVLALVGCNGDDGSARAAKDSKDKASHDAAAAAMDATFDKELGEAKAKPAAEKPKPAAVAVAEKPKPKPVANAKPAIEQGRPAWVDQLPQEAGKLYAVGGAMKGRREDARRKALTELASSLRVNIKSTTTVNEGEITKIGPGGERVGHAWSNYKSECRLSVDRDLTFATVVAEAESGKDTWALAELDRAAWAAKLRLEIEDVDARLRAEGNRLAEAGSGMMPAARALKAVGPLGARRDVLVSDLILADPQSKPPPWPIDMTALLQACAKGLATVTIRIEGAPDAVFAARTQEAMAKQGLAVNDKAGSVVLRLALRETPRTLPGQNWISIAVAGSATVLDPNNGNVAGSLQIDEKGVDLDPAQARAKMLDKASAAIALAISDRLIDLLAGGTDVGNGPAVAAPVAPAPVVVAPPAPAPAVATPTVPAPVVAAPTVAAPTAGQAAIDQHFIYADEVFIDDKAYNGEGWSYVELAKVLQLPNAESRGQGKYFPIVKGKEVWTAHAWSTRPIAANEITLGQTVIVCNDNQREGVYLPPADKKEARTGGWFIGRITDVSDLFKNQVTVAGHYTIATSNLRVVAPVK